MKICPRCGLEFVPLVSLQKYCGRRFCFAPEEEKKERIEKRLRGPKVPIQKIICPGCNILFKPKKRGYYFCSLECRKKFNTVEVNCHCGCGKTFFAKRCEKRKFFSWECFRKKVLIGNKFNNGFKNSEGK